MGTKMEYSSAIHDPLTINLKRQTQILLSKIPSPSPHATALLNASTREDLLATLSALLAVPSLTLFVATAFRPLLVPLCARWLDNEENQEEKLVALCLLVHPHEEVFPILSQLLRKPSFQGGPLAFLLTSPSVGDIDGPHLHRLLIAYYRILLANCELPYNLLWSLSPLSMLFWIPHPDTGVRLLAIRCYAMQSGMGEDEREKLETEILGQLYGVDCQVTYGQNRDGSSREIDGWVLPALEAKRISDARNSILTEAQDYYTVEEGECNQPINSGDLGPFVANVHGILLLRSSGSSKVSSPLVHTPTVIQSLRTLAIHLSLRLPTLVTSPPSSGKSLLLSHLAATLHPGVNHQIIDIHFADTSLDPRSLLGAYVSSPTNPGTFEWKEGILVRAMREGRWVVFKDIDRGSNEVLGVIKPLVESLRMGKWIGGLASLEVPSRGRVIAHEDFALFATRSLAVSRNGNHPPPVFFGAHKFHEIVVPSPTSAELTTIINAKFPRLAGQMTHALIRLWDAVKAHGSVASTRDVGYRELEKFCSRIENLLASSHHQLMDLSSDSDEIIPLQAILPNTALREEMYLEARDVFFGAGTLTASACAHAEAIAVTIAENLGLEPDRRDWVLRGRIPEFQIEKDVDGKTTAARVGRTRLLARPTKVENSSSVARPFAMHRPAVLLLSRIATALSLGEPVLLTGETGTGKTSVVTHLASLLNRPLISLNLSHQTESSDLVGGFKPVDARVPASELHERFLELFGATFSRRKNAKFDESVRKAVLECKWKRVVGLWKESVRLAKDRILAKQKEQKNQLLDTGDVGVEADMPRKRRKMNQNELVASEANWNAFQQDVEEFEIQHVHGKGKFTFGFVEGPLVKALRSGDWILLDEINLTSPETLECISGMLHSPTATITLAERGSLEPIPRHPDFRLFACMNPATDVGKKDLPSNIRSRFTEIDVPPPDADRETLLSIVTQYIGPSAVGDKAAIMNVVEFYSAVKILVQERQIADGSNRSPHYSMRTLARALTFAADTAIMYGLRRSLWEGCLMAFTMVLDNPSAEVVTGLAQKHILAGVRNPQSLLSKAPSAPRSHADGFVKLGHFHLEKGPLPEDPVDDYIITPSVEKKLIDLARIMVTRRYPVLIEGPTSSGKTSSVEYLARRTGHRFIRINNHEHTDIQEYLGSYVPDPTTGKLVFKDGLLTRALRNGDWIILDELNLAPTDVLEALNRLLDDNRELIIPETQEVLRPHPHFMLFATQNPPGLYAGRKVLSRAFRSRFLEVHFEDVPQVELESILCQKCRIAPSYGQRIVCVFRELQKRRQSGRVFESKHGFATLRDLFRWAGRDANGYQELAENGYMLLGERARREDDKRVVKEVIELEMRVKIDEKAIYNLQNPGVDFPSYLACPIPSSPKLVWTTAMQRLFILVARALRFNEPVLLVGETGSGKTSVCQVYADAVSRKLHSLNCHQHTETADLIGGLRPVRNRSANQSEVLHEASTVLKRMGVDDIVLDEEFLFSSLNALLTTPMDLDSRILLENSREKLLRLKSIFEWRDGPLVEAMRNGDVFLLDEISLADDSVLERLNSVLEPARTIVLAERGGDDLEHSAIQAADIFQLLATMNPGGDYGKKELSPALRNRFTEIWVPPVYQRADLEMIVNSLWENEAFIPYTTCVLDFGEWLCTKVGDRSVLSLRDILAWVDFSNIAYKEKMPPNIIYHHAAHLTLLDGFGSLPQLASYSFDALLRLKADALSKLEELVPRGDSETPLTYVPTYDPTKFLQFGPFSIAKGSGSPFLDGFNLQAPTTRQNAMRVVRACQLPKSILLEGSPGVGKTSLITALANITGHVLYRINLSDQTDLVDLFGSDLPVEGGGPGDFAWKDAEFLKAMQEGHWVLLDEMNLAPQAVLEGLNAILDHRGIVYIPELGRSFIRHPAFRIFAAQNPLHQGGGRKGLPKSFVNRFTKVYLDELSPNDLVLVCQHLFPDTDEDILRAMVTFNTRLNQEINSKRMFASEGAPWEFNLRDVIRWGLLCTSRPPRHPVEHLNTVYLHRFRTVADRNYARSIFDEVFSASTSHLDQFPYPSISASHLQIGHFRTNRKNCNPWDRPGCLLQVQLPTLETAGHCITQSWLSIITGPRDSGKTELVRTLAHLTGNTLRVISINSATDTTDIVGSFEQVDNHGHVLAIVRQVLSVVENHSRTVSGSRSLQNEHYSLLQAAVRASPVTVMSLPHVLQVAADLLAAQINLDEHLTTECENLHAGIQKLNEIRDEKGCFEWVDGPFIQAMKQGHWVLMDDANLCSPSVLDRLNSLCESEGVLVLSERGYVDGKVQILKPHPNFRLFMSIDHQYGELSRAMRNRGIEIALVTLPTVEDWKRLRDHLHLPEAFLQDGNIKSSLIQYDTARRGVVLSKVPTSASDMLWLSGPPLVQDSPLSNVIEQAVLLSNSASSSTAVLDSLLYFFARVAVPAYVPLLIRLFSALKTDALATLFHQIQCLLQTFVPRFLSITAGVREEYSRSIGSPPAFICAQPLDIFVGCTPCLDCKLEYDNPSLHRTILQILNFCVALFIYQGELGTAGKGCALDTVQWLEISNFEQGKIPRIVKAIEAVTDTIARIGQMLFDKLDPGNLVWTSDLDLALNLLRHTRQLRVAATSRSSFDFSGVQANSKWIEKVLQGHSSNFAQLYSDFKALHELVSLSSGLGLAEIWSALLVDSPIELIPPDLTRLDMMACNLKELENIQGLRMQTFELMTLRSQPTKTTEQDQLVVANLTLEVEPRLLENSREDGICRDHQIENGHLIAELVVLSELGGRQVAIGSQAQFIQEIIDLVCGNPRCSLLRLASYRHALGTINMEKGFLPILARCQIQWLNSLWNTGFLDNLVEGPSILLRPALLRATMLIYDWRQKSLSSLKDYESTVHRHVRLISLVCRGVSTRTEQLTSFLHQSILLIASCFSSSFSDSAWQSMQELSRQSQLGEQPATLRLLLLLEQSKHKPLLHAIQHCLRPALLSLVKSLSSRRQTISSLGLCWMALSRLIIDLYIPNIPIDPAATQRCIQELWSQEEMIVASEIDLHSKFETRRTGNDSNAIVTFLQARLNEIARTLATVPPLPFRAQLDIAGLQRFWSEVSQFQSQVISSSKIDSLLLLFETGDATAPMREQVVQQSITTFCQRLNTAYPEYTDVSTALQLALLHLKLGLRFIAHSAGSSDTSTLVGTALAVFPSVQSSAMLRAEQETTRPSDMTTSRYLLLRLAAVGLERSLGVDLEDQIHFVERTYDQIFRLWLIDRARENDLDLTSQSLYKHKPLDYDAASDAEAETREFLALFPQFEDALQQNTHPGRGNSHQPSLLVDASQTQTLVDIHHSLLTASHPSSELSRPYVVFNDIRKLELECLLETQITSLSDLIDLQSYAFQFFLMNDRLSGLRTIFKPTEKPYNFYVDANALEVTKAAVIIEKLKARLDALIQEWPDQMVLQDLRSRCELFLSLDLHSPVAKILSALEQLLMHSEDWEIYANRENTLKDHQQTITSLIVDWRRLELSSWQALLQAQAKSFSDGTAEWWFRLYDVAIRGSLDVLRRESQDFTNYLISLSPLLDDFIQSSPLGQYQSRLQLLQSFARYANYLACNKSGRVRLGLDRVERVLHATARYYGLYAPSISSRLSEQQTRIETEIRGFIKLASWKDINVHALKQSAQRTHRQLYNCVRKFRNVMRQPIVGLLQPELAGDAESKPLSNLATDRTNIPSPNKPSFSNEAPIGILSNHLLNLDRTFQRFDTLIAGRIRLFLNSHTAIAVDNFAIDIISTAKTLNALSIRNSDPSDKREKQQKALLVRKRRSWSDLLKELKRAGFAVNMKPENRSRLGDMHWIREQPILSNPSGKFVSVEKCEIYLNRLYGSLPELRNLLSNHHPDITTRELQRGVSLLESGFSMALDTRSCLAAAFESFHKLERISRRLNMVPSSAVIHAEPELTRRVAHLNNAICRLTNALDELMHGVRIFNDLLPNQTISTSYMEKILTLTTTTKVFRDQLSAVLDDVRLTDFPLLLDKESALIDDILRHFERSSHTLQQWSEEEPSLRYLFHPIQAWLKVQEISVFHSSELQPTVLPINGTDAIIDALLINVQNLLATCPNSIHDHSLSEVDFYIREDCNRFRDFTRLLNLDKVFDNLSGALPGLAQCPQDALQRNLGRLLPFLNRYMELAEEHLTIYSQWMKALCKLDYVLCSLMHSLAKQGFCKPPNTDESSSGGDIAEAIEGVGLGEGSGTEDVSKEIEEESQVEGLQSDVNDPQERHETSQDGSAIEMSEDFGGDMEDIPETGSQGGRESDEGSQTDPEEQLGKLDTSDPSAVDEKLWGDEQGPQDQANDQTNHDHSTHQEHSEMVAKEKPSNTEKDPEIDDKEQEEESAPEDHANDQDQYPDTSGAPMDSYVPDAHTLDLPDDLDLGSGEEMEDHPTDHDDSEMMDNSQPEPVSEDEGNAVETANPDNHVPTEQGQEFEQPQDSDVDKDVAEEDDTIVGQPDISAGQGVSTNERHYPDSCTDKPATSEAGNVSGTAGQDPEAEEQTNQDGSPEDAQPQDDAQAAGEGAAGAATNGFRQGLGLSPRNQPSSSEPLRSLGDTLQQIRRPFEDICDGNATTDPSHEHLGEESQLEYARPDDSDHDMQALGPAGAEQVAKLNELKIVDDRVQIATPMDVDVPCEIEKFERPRKEPSIVAEALTDSICDHIEGAIARSDRFAFPENPNVPQTTSDIEMVEVDDTDVEVELKTWQAEGLPEDRAEHLWHSYEALTHDLAHALCEQLRLILEPTLATRLKGDYRTGKRLNMKKIIPYIASDYTKDKIWLRRTRPSQREYQVLIAVDDSRSMSESHSVHLAYQTLALMSKALSRLEVGDLALVKFGEAMEILHGFNEGPFTDQAGTKVMNAFRFNQTATNVLSLVEASLDMLELARERRSISSPSAGDLWQLEIIISDGICQDHDRLRTVVRKAEEQRVIIIFIIIDSLLPTTQSTMAVSGLQNSILSMKQATYKNIGGRMELQMQRYLDSFPFEYYVVLRNVEALPEVLSATLRQFFERISEQ